MHACSASPAARWASASTSETKKSLRANAASDALGCIRVPDGVGGAAQVAHAVPELGG